jgi:hypothetical protein
MIDGGDGPASGAVSNGDGGVGDVGTGGTDGGTGGTSAGYGGMPGGSNTGAAGGGGVGGDGSVGCVPDANCSCEVFQGHDYRFCAVPTVRDAGLAACQSENMGLVRVETAEEDAWLLEQFVAHNMFIGGGGPIVLLEGNDIQVEGSWTWDDGTLFWKDGPVGSVYVHWGSPPTKSGQDDCMGMVSDGTWAGRPCNTGNATVACESR